MKTNSLQKLIITIVITIFLLIGAVLVVTRVVFPRVGEYLGGIFSNNRVESFHAYFNLDPAVPQLVFDGRRARDVLPPLVEIIDGEPRVYLRADFLRNGTVLNGEVHIAPIDPFIFWDEGANALFVSTQYEMLEFTPGSEFFLVNGSPRPLDDAIIQTDSGVFLPSGLVEALYPVSVEFLPLYNMVVLTSINEVQTYATVSASRADIRYFPAANAPITTRPSHGDELTLFIGGEEEDDLPGGTQISSHDFVRVRTADGLLGYVLISEIENLRTEVPGDFIRRETILNGFVDNTIHFPQTWAGGAINLVWDNLENTAPSPLNASVNVVSPVWFRICETGTQLTSIANLEYVERAHEQNAQVWPLVFDVDSTRARRFLTDRNARRTAINQLVEFVDTYNLDGINIDFEHLFAADLGPYKLQFLRELAIPMRARGIILSAAVKVPIPETMFYRRDLIGQTVDFVMVMAYDEHWSTSETAGPVASLPWVRRGVNNMLIEVPAERLILGMPFYNRVWREVLATGALTSNAWGINRTRTFFEERNVSWVWDFEMGSYFGEVSAVEQNDNGENETVIYRVWLEDARSVQEKMHIFADNNLAGVAVWSRFFENDAFWNVIAPYF
jgi:spore germination protein YaaH